MYLEIGKRGNVQATIGRLVTMVPAALQLSSTEPDAKWKPVTALAASCSCRAWLEAQALAWARGLLLRPETHFLPAPC